jgi:hypothetical protein
MVMDGMMVTMKKMFLPEIELERGYFEERIVDRIW